MGNWFRSLFVRKDVEAVPLPSEIAKRWPKTVRDAFHLSNAWQWQGVDYFGKERG